MSKHFDLSENAPNHARPIVHAFVRPNKNKSVSGNGSGKFRKGRHTYY